MAPSAVTLIVLAVSVGLFISNRFPVGVVAILTALALPALGIIDLSTALAGFGDPAVIFIATLFVVSTGLENSGITAWAGRQITSRVGTGRVALLVAVMLVTAVLSALISPNGAASAMIPIVLAASRSSHRKPSALLMPVAFAASAGALLTLSGSVVNVMTSETAREVTGTGFGFFEFARAGVLLVAGTVVAAIVFAKLIPTSRDASITKDFGSHLDTLLDHYEIDQGFFHLLVGPRTAAGTSVTRLRSDGVRVYAAQSPGGAIRGDDEVLQPGDIALATGPTGKVSRLAADVGMEIDLAPLTRKDKSRLIHEHVGLAEVLVPPRSPLIGQRVVTGMQRGEITVLSVRRGDRPAGTSQLRLRVGDALLLHGSWPAILRLEEDEEVLLIDSPEEVRRQVAPLGANARWAALITTAMVVLLASGAVAPAVAGLLAACALVLTGVVSVTQAYRAISWQTVVLIGGLMSLSVAIRVSGAADIVARLVLGLAGSGGLIEILAVLFVVTAALGQVISNTATALVMLPIVVAISQ
ncbi:MAG: SLC13 family permease, partial [Propionibacterium sp.]